MKSALLLSFLFASCSKVERHDYFYVGNPMPERIISNYYNYPSSDTLFVSGITSSTFHFFYLVKDSCIITEKKYLNDEYQLQMINLAHSIYGRLFADVVPGNTLLYNYKIGITLFNMQVLERPLLSWPLYEVKW